MREKLSRLGRAAATQHASSDCGRSAERLLLAGAMLSVTLFAPPVAAQELRLVAGGDIEWDLDLRKPGIYMHPSDDWRPIPYLLTPERREYLARNHPEILEALDFHYHDSIQYGLTFDSPEDMARHPFRRIAAIFRDADISFVNLETGLSDSARRAYDKALRTPASFAEGIAWAGIDVVSVANNHAMDAEGAGAVHTLEHLSRAGVAHAGGGRNLEEARSPVVLERNGIRIAFLAYAQFINQFGAQGFALDDRAGPAPMDPFLIREDIRRVRDHVDHVILSLHWDHGGSHNSSSIVEPSRAAREFAYDMIDAGADLILGHHPPLPRGIEIHRGKPIVYSLGKLIFGHNHTEWTDNMLVRFTFTKDEISAIEVLPVAGEGRDMAQPYPLEGERAQRLLEIVRDRSALLGTEIESRGNIGQVRIPPARARR
jgi:poly-gamma-glutamate capsule biosynthesis protein CapA/YwtB (metallophosphatase superfamily)